MNRVCSAHVVQFLGVMVWKKFGVEVLHGDHATVCCVGSGSLETLVTLVTSCYLILQQFVSSCPKFVERVDRSENVEVPPWVCSSSWMFFVLQLLI